MGGGVKQPGALRTPESGSRGGFIRWAQWINSLANAIDSAFSPSPLPEGCGGGWSGGQWGPKVPNLQSCLGLSVTSPHPEAI